MVWHQEELLMITKNMKIEISTGLEARPVAVFVQVASQFESSIYVEVGNKKVNAKSTPSTPSTVIGDKFGQRHADV